MNRRIRKQSVTNKPESSYLRYLRPGALAQLRDSKITARSHLRLHDSHISLHRTISSSPASSPSRSPSAVHQQQQQQQEVVEAFISADGELLNMSFCIFIANTVKYEVRLEDGTLVTKSDGVEFKVEDGHFCPALSKALKTMKKGEKVVLTVKPEYGFGEKGKSASGDEGSIPANASLQITLELLSRKTVTNITDDKKVIKKILKEGEGYDRPNEGAVVQVKLIGKLKNGNVFAKKGHDDSEPLEFKEYIHRVGRTARGEGAKGNTLFFLILEELQFLRYLKSAKVPVKEYEFDENKIVNVQSYLVFAALRTVYFTAIFTASTTLLPKD